MNDWRSQMHVLSRLNDLERRVESLESARVVREGGVVGPGDREGKVAEASSVKLFKRSGLFHEPVPGKEVCRVGARGLLFTGLWRRIRVSLTVEISGWDAEDPDGLHGIFWLYRDGRWRGNTIGYVNVRGPGRHRLTVLNNIDMPDGETRRKAPTWIPRLGVRYRLFYDYNSDLEQAVVFDIDGVAENAPLYAPGPLEIGESLHLEVGLHRGLVEVPSYGWRYSNLLVEGWRS